jgi:uncharacterized membrane protein
MVAMAQQFAGPMIGRASGMVMLVATALALLAGFAVGPPSGDPIIFAILFMLGLVVFLGACALRLRCVGRIPKEKAEELIAPHFQPLVRMFLQLWVGLLGASLILLLAGLASLATGIATNAVWNAFFYLASVTILNQCIGGTLVNVAIVRSASQKGGTPTG